MSAQSAVLAGRRAAEARMKDTCTVGRITTAVDPDTLETIDVIESHYSGKCRVSSASNAVSEKNTAGQAIADETLILSVPMADAGLIVTDDSMTITAVDPVAGNPVMVGRKFRIAGLASVSQATAARYALELLS